MKHISYLLLAVIVCMTACRNHTGETINDILTKDTIDGDIVALQSALRADNTRFGVTLHSYEFHRIFDTPAPKGYKPFYISHYGRHGSRSDWGKVAYMNVKNVLEEAKQKGVLTGKGEVLLSKTDSIILLYNGMDGRLTDRGEREHARLAERMYYRFRPVFKSNNGQPILIQSIASRVPRCIISMAAFTNSLTSLNQHIGYNFDTGDRMQEYIDCCKPESDRMKANIRRIQDSLMAQLPFDSTFVLEALFSDTNDLQLPNLKDFQRDIFNTCAVAQDYDIALNVLDYMAFETAYYWQMNATYTIALRTCNIVGISDERIPNAQIAVNELVEKADAAIADGIYVADLRFGHDYPLVYFVNRLGISGVGEQLLPGEIEQRWWAHRNITMASNLQVIFYRSDKSEEILVKVLYNEVERRIIGLEPISGPYYRWADVRAKWCNN